MGEVKKRYSGSGVCEYVKEKEEVRGRVGQGMEFLHGVGWMGFAGTEG